MAVDVSFSRSILFCEHEGNEVTSTIPFLSLSCIGDCRMDEVGKSSAEKILHVEKIEHGNNAEKARFAGKSSTELRLARRIFPHVV